MNLLQQQMEKHTNMVLCTGIKHSMQGRMVSCLKSQLVEYNIWRNATAGMHYACTTMLYGNGSCTASDHEYIMQSSRPCCSIAVQACSHQACYSLESACIPVPDCIDDDVQHTFTRQLVQ